MRTLLEEFVHENVIGIFIMNSISFASIVTSFMFIVLSYFDHSLSDECCMRHYDDPLLAALEGDCSPPCDQFLMVRMPRWFATMDMVICFSFFIEYSINLYISQNRCTYFLTAESCITIFLIIMPPIFFSYETGRAGLQM